MPTTLYEDLKQLGVAIESHESDLYTPDTEQARTLAKQHGKTFTVFTSKTDAKRWLDIPFAFDPFWTNKQKTPPVAYTPVTEIDCKRLTELLGYIYAFRSTPIVDDDFPSMRDRADNALVEAAKIVSDALAAIGEGTPQWFVPAPDKTTRKPLVISGPQASGKTELARSLATGVVSEVAGMPSFIGEFSALPDTIIVEGASPTKQKLIDMVLSSEIKITAKNKPPFCIPNHFKWILITHEPWQASSDFHVLRLSEVSQESTIDDTPDLILDALLSARRSIDVSLVKNNKAANDHWCRVAAKLDKAIKQHQPNTIGLPESIIDWAKAYRMTYPPLRTKCEAGEASYAEYDESLNIELEWLRDEVLNLVPDDKNGNA